MAAHLDRWLQDAAKPTLRPRTYESYKMICEQHLTPALGRVPLVRLTPQNVQHYMNDKREAGLSARTVQYHHAVLRRGLVQAERWGLVPRNVAKLVTPPKVERDEVRPLTPAQARVFLDAVKGDRLYAVYAVALGLGLRQGEVLGLRWEDLDLNDGTLAVRHTLQLYGGVYHLDPPKTKRSRRTLGLPVPLVDALRAHRLRQLQERLKAGSLWQGDAWGLVFTTETGTPLNTSVVTHCFKGHLTRLGLPPQRFHDTRHAAATFLLAQGVPLRVVMDILGHANIAVTANTYSHVLPELQREAVGKVGALLFGAPNG